MDDLAEFIFYDEPDLKQEAVKALERIGTASALARLEQVAGTKKCDADILDAVDVLRSNLTAPPAPKPESPSIPNRFSAASLIAPDFTDRAAAYDYFSGQGDLVARLLHEHMDTPDPDLLINLLRLTARTFPREALGRPAHPGGPAKKDLENPVKFSVYTALSRFPQIDSAAAILNGITDPAMYIRMAAVKLLDRHCSDFITAEIKKKIESGTKTGESLGITILDTKAVRLIDALMDSDTFSYISSNYLERNAPVQVIDAYISVLEKRGRRSTVKKYTRLLAREAEQQVPLMAVIHPDAAALDVYAKLIHGCGLRALTFTDAQEAFESIMARKPVAVVCDLFLGQLTALDLARDIRDIYPMEEFPIQVSSLQKSLDLTLLTRQLKQAGINGPSALFRPKPGQIKSWARFHRMMPARTIRPKAPGHRAPASKGMPGIRTLGFKPNFSDYSPAERERIMGGPKDILPHRILRGPFQRHGQTHLSQLSHL